MKKRISIYLVFVLFTGVGETAAQNVASLTDSIRHEILPVPLQDCPIPIKEALSKDSLQNKTALVFINLANHPLGKYELNDKKKRYKQLQVKIAMKRITLLYVEPGLHRFHSIYQKHFNDVMYKPGEIYIAALITTSQWPVPYTFVKEDKFGREYVPVLLYYINGAEAEELLNQIKQRDVVVNGIKKR
jgi:hypothetical protein